MPRISILGVPIDSISLREAILLIQEMLASPVQRHVMTPNSEMLVEAFHNPAFFSVLQKTALNVPDSAGLLWAARKTGQVLLERVAGVDVVAHVCRELHEDMPVFFLGGRNGVARCAFLTLREQNSQLHVVGVYEGSPRDEDLDEIVRRVNKAKPVILFVAYGSPQQDMWISRNLHRMPSVRIAMGVGGTFDFLAGKAKRAPMWMQRIGLEWLWRVIREPWRIRRICTAVIVFPWLVMRYGRARIPSLV